MNEAAQSLSAHWRCLAPTCEGRRTYVLNEDVCRVMILDTWPDDQILASCRVEDQQRPPEKTPSVADKVCTVSDCVPLPFTCCPAAA